MNRREFIGDLASAGAATLLASSMGSASAAQKSIQKPPSKKMPLYIFSKHLQWLDYDGMAKAAAELGFDGVALTVRRGGHVLPERVETDLPKAVAAVRKAGIDVGMLITDVYDVSDPVTEKILRTASGLGIRYYRLGYMHYDQDKDILEQLEATRPKMKALADMNQNYKIFGGNHNHTGNCIGTSLWDAWDLFKGLNPEWIGFQYDTGNGFNEGIGGSWKTNARLVASRIKMLAVKTGDKWGQPEWQNDTINKRENRPILTRKDFDWFFGMLKKTGVEGPVAVHYEFPGLGGAETGAKELKGMSKEEVLAIIRRNLNILKEMIAKTG